MTAPSSSKSKAFTLLELLVVISAIALLITISLPRFGLFQSSEELKADALALKSNMRLAQNNAIASLKVDPATGSGCSAGDTLVGWYTRLQTALLDYEYGGFCDNGATISLFGSRQIRFNQGVQVQQIELADPLTSASNIIILFKPANLGVDFLNSVGASLNFDSAIITLRNQKNERYQVTVNKAGDIYERAL